LSAPLLTLADSRLPAGGHAHSGGVEEACAIGLVRDVSTLEAFLARRLTTAGRVAASLAAAAYAGTPGLDAEADVRTPSPALKRASRAQGRGLVRVARLAWPSEVWDTLPKDPHHPVALGTAASAAGLTARDAALAAAYLAVSGPATAAQRLLGMDPMRVAAVTARLDVDAEADRAVTGPLSACTDPLLDLLAEQHALRREKYFAS
jgi:urease accessory protein